MSAVQQAAVNTVLRIANLFEQNCALKHGLPKVGGPDRIDTAGEVQPTPADPVAELALAAIGKLAGPQVSPVSSSPSPGAGAAQQPDGQPFTLWRAAPYILAALGIAGAGVAGYSLAPTHETVIEQVTQPQVTQPNDGSLLQTLQDRGLHLPDGQWQTK